MATSAVNSQTATQPESDRRTRRRARFVRILTAITAAIHVPVAIAVTAIADRPGVSHPALLGCAWAVLGVVFFVRRAPTAADTRRSEWLIRLVDIPYFIHWCAALWMLIPSVLASLLVPVADLVLGRPIVFPVGVFVWSYLSGLVVCAYGTLVRRRWLRVVEREVRIPDLDPGLDGLRIAHLSDLHIGALTPRSWGLGWSLAANACKPDLAVVTGDLVTSGTEFHSDVADVIGALRAEQGVFVSMGNHDYFGDGEPLVGKLRDRGVRVLRNDGVVVERGGAKIWLAAIDDTWTQRDDLASALRDRPRGAMTLLLAHDPSRFDEAAEAGVNLVLSGHTHGGQIAMPFVYRALNLATFVYRYTVGFYRSGRAVLYVHPGLGTTGPPMRLGVAPEVTLLVLRAKGGERPASARE